ncbi:MAG: hypothetical protein CM15mV22_1360 [Eurybiavirus sp.]|nr:MAG: hypothetical protein CM15mV22_1360 [Eurybiavirus sp.]
MPDGMLMKGETHKESAWQRKEGKNKSGGLNEKGRKSYEREILVQISKHHQRKRKQAKSKFLC